MKSYPRISYYDKGIIGNECICFDKLDGSNIRLEWSKKRGFYKFGTRNRMIDKNDEQFGQTIDLFLNKYNEDLSKIFRDEYPKSLNFVVFAEYVGPNSFAGWHDENDEMDIILFDINQYQKGFINPYELLEKFGHVHLPEIIYEGKYTKEIIEDIRSNKYNLSEGVIAKGVHKTRKGNEQLWYCKIKTYEWLDKVKAKLGEKALSEEFNNTDQIFIK